VITTVKVIIIQKSQAQIIASAFRKVNPVHDKPRTNERYAKISSFSFISIERRLQRHRPFYKPITIEVISDPPLNRHLGTRCGSEKKDNVTHGLPEPPDHLKPVDLENVLGPRIFFFLFRLFPRPSFKSDHIPTANHGGYSSEDHCWRCRAPPAP